MCVAEKHHRTSHCNQLLEYLQPHELSELVLVRYHSTLEQLKQKSIMNSGLSVEIFNMYLLGVSACVTL